MPHNLIDLKVDPRRRYVGAHRHSRETPAASISPTLSPTSSPYPLPYYLPRSKIHQNLLNGADPTTAPTDQPSSSSSSRHLRHSAPDVIYGHGPRLPSSFSSLHHRGSSVSHGARARFASLPAVVSSIPRIDTECDRLERACGRAPIALLRIRDELPPSSPHQPRGDGPPPSLAPKWPHLQLVLRIKRALRRDGKDIRDYIEAEQINELYHRDVEERARRERERGRMARMRAGQESSDCDGKTRSYPFFICFWNWRPCPALVSRRAALGLMVLPCLFADIFGVPLNESILRAPATAILGGYRHDLPLVVFLCVEELYRTGEHLQICLSPLDRAFLQASTKVVSSATFPIANDTTN